MWKHVETYGNIEDKLHLPSDCCLDLGCLGCGEVGISGYCILFKTVHPFVISWFMSFLWGFAECFIVVFMSFSMFVCCFLCSSITYHWSPQWFKHFTIPCTGGGTHSLQVVAGLAPSSIQSATWILPDPVAWLTDAQSEHSRQLWSIRFLMVFVNLMRSTKISLSVSMSGSPSQKPNILEDPLLRISTKMRRRKHDETLWTLWKERVWGLESIFGRCRVFPPTGNPKCLSMSQVWVSSRVKCCPATIMKMQVYRNV